MKILYIFRSIAVWGGIERILVDKMNWLSERYGMDVYLLTSDQGNLPIPYNLSKGVHHDDFNICFYRQYRFRGFRRLIMAGTMARQYRRLLADRLQIIHPDLIICTTADRISTIAKLKGDIPLVVESHSICFRTVNHGRNWLLKRLYRYHFIHSLSKVDMIVALTEGDAHEWRKYHSCVTVIPNFVHKHEQLVSNYTSKKAIFVGRYDYQKRVQDAILIWEKVRERHPDWTLEIYGDGDMLQEVSSLASTIGGVAIHQPTSRIFHAYQDCSFLISTSLFEPFGLVIPEAMSCGLPVLAFDCPYGPGDMIADGEDGYIIKGRDIDAFADRICILIEKPELRKSMGQKALTSSQRYTPEHVMPLWLQLFGLLLHSDIINQKQVSVYEE